MTADEKVLLKSMIFLYKMPMAYVKVVFVCVAVHV